MDDLHSSSLRLRRKNQKPLKCYLTKVDPVNRFVAILSLCTDTSVIKQGIMRIWY